MPPRDNRKHGPITKRGTKRKTREEIGDAIREGQDSRSYEDGLEYHQKLRESHRSYGDRLSEGFGMLGGD